MSHEVETRAYAFKNTLWPGLGTFIGEAQTREAMMRLSQTDWMVGLERVYLHDGIEIPDVRAILRLSDRNPLGMASDHYEPTQNAEKFAAFDAALAGRAAWISMGSLKGGSIVYGLAEIPGDWSIAGEAHERYLLALGYHDGKTADHFLTTCVRVECNNTRCQAVSAARNAKTELAKGIRVTHRGDVQAKLSDVSDTFERALGDFNGYRERMETLVSVRLSEADERNILESILEGSSKRTEAARETIIELAHTGKGNRPVAGTAYGLLQGTSEYVDHHRLQETTPERRFFYQVDGAGSRLKQRMEATLLREYAAANDTSGVDGAGVLDAMLQAS